MHSFLSIRRFNVNAHWPRYVLGASVCLLPQLGLAADCTQLGTAGNTVVTADCTNASVTGVLDVTINAGVTVNNSGSNLAIANQFRPSSGLLTNNGTISSDFGGLWVNNSVTAGLVNTGTITNSHASNAAINVTDNYSNQGWAVVPQVTLIENSGTIESTNAGAFAISNLGGVITTITNTGSIIGGSGRAGISNDDYFQPASIQVLNNLQGSGNANGPLTITGNLPVNYNIIIDSASVYGRLRGVSYVNGSLNFGIYGTSHLAAGTYSSVLSGLTSANISNYASIFDVWNNFDSTYRWKLLAGATADTWDLLVAALVLGPSAVDTQASLHSLAPKLRTYYTQQAIATNFANMNTYDCNLFDAKGVCVSVGGQQTYVDDPSSNLTSTVVVAGYKVSPTFRIGGFLNQNLNNNTVSGVQVSNANPLMGLFAVWNQNEDHLGYQVKIANAYQDKDVTTTREIIGSSEAGKGRTTLNTQSYVGEVSYAFLVNAESTLIRPYAALRYTRIQQDGYTEEPSVSSPLTYAALTDRSTTALVGVKLNQKLTDKISLMGSLGVEQDLHHHVNDLTASGISGLASENFNDSIQRTRPVASVGAVYRPSKNQRIAADVYYQQLPFQSTGAATAYVNYTIGF